MKMTQAEWEKSIQWAGLVAGCVISKGDKFLLVQEKNPKAYGLWNLPAGYVDKDEELKAAAIREAREESGFVVEIDHLIEIYHETAKEPVKHAYRAHIVGGELKVQEDEILDVKWFSFDEINELNKQNKLRAPWVFRAISSSIE